MPKEPITVGEFGGTVMFVQIFCHFLKLAAANSLLPADLNQILRLSILENSSNDNFTDQMSCIEEEQ